MKAAALWPHLRAALVALHVLAVLLMATPAPGEGLRRSAWEDPTVQAEFAAWNARLRGFGIDWPQEDMEDDLWAFASGYDSVRRRIVAPFQAYGRRVGASQSWRMFVAPHRYPTRLHVDIEENGVWRPIYIERSPEHTWSGRMLDHDRFRSAIFRFGWPHYRRSYASFAAWLAKRAAADFPGATRLRTRMHKVRSPSPEEVRTGREPEGSFQQEQVIVLRGEEQGG